ncbi:GATA transcription factor 8-like [Salvia divinorum]|uniref:GATA transcription factor n=1 Tax=Salvia divinorum TaxID=28513 RepID=A0ABD1GE93_SALDI
MGPNLGDEIDCANFFDQIDDLIEFPPENECGGGAGAGAAGAGDFVGSGDPKDVPSMWSDSLPETDLFFANRDAASDLSAELSVPYEDILQLEWLSNFVEDSFSGGGMTIPKESPAVPKEPPSHHQFQTSSPVSVLESSSSSNSNSSSNSFSGGMAMPFRPTPAQRGPQRARSKRPRPATFNPRAAIQLLSPPPVPVEAPPKFVPTESENFAESPPETAVAEQKKKKKIKITPPASLAEVPAPVRKCMHCEITKTPQWRAGPMGPKSLCNACGVRYKSGRLFPEYRPAASPTFVPSLHSNSHKKVVEMRTKLPTTSEAEPEPMTEAEHDLNP